MADNKGQSTVDLGEVERHTNLKGGWWNPLGTVPALHSLNEVRIPYIVDGIASAINSKDKAKPLAGYKILDIGCGGGLLSEGLAKFGGIVTGIDPSAELVDLAREHCNKNFVSGQNKPTYICTTVEEHAKDHQNYYDFVAASEVIDHVVNKELFIKSSLEVLKPGGKIFVTAPNKTRFARFYGIYLAENIFNCIAKGLHDYEKFISPEDVTKIMHKHNCKVDNTYGLFYYPIINKWQWVFFNHLWYALEATKLE